MSMLDKIEKNTNLGVDGQIEPLHMDAMGPVTNVPIFNLTDTFPRFIYMLYDDVSAVVACKQPTDRSIVNKTRFFNYKYDIVKGIFVDTEIELPPTPENIQKFCDESMRELLMEKARSQPQRAHVGTLVPAYPRVYI